MSDVRRCRRRRETDDVIYSTTDDMNRVPVRMRGRCCGLREMSGGWCGMGGAKWPGKRYLKALRQTLQRERREVDDGEWEYDCLCFKKKKTFIVCVPKNSDSAMFVLWKITSLSPHYYFRNLKDLRNISLSFTFILFLHHCKCCM